MVQEYGRSFDMPTVCMRRGDHISYISDLRKMRAHYPKWDINKDLRTTMTEIWEARAARTAADGATGRGVAGAARA
jgi:hypothetical protein